MPLRQYWRGQVEYIQPSLRAGIEQEIAQTVAREIGIECLFR